MKGQGQSVGRDALAVVGHPNEAESALPYLDRHVAGTGIEAVIYQLLHHRGWALHHLAGGDKDGHVGRKNANGQRLKLTLHPHILPPAESYRQRTTLTLPRSLIARLIVHCYTSAIDQAGAEEA